MLLFTRVQLGIVEILFNKFEEVHLKIITNINLDIMKKEYISITVYPLNNVNPLVSDPRQF